MPDPASPPSPPLPRLCFVAYPRIREFALPVVAEFASRAQVELVEGSFDAALALARERVERGTVDVFVSAGSNAAILRAGVQAPVATIQLTGFDLLQALMRARAVAERVGVVTYGQTLPELEAARTLLNIDIQQHAYQAPDEARLRCEQLRQAGFKVVVGSSLVVDAALACGLIGLLAYSPASVRRGFEDALELARVARLEAGRYEPLHGVLQSLQEAVLAVDRQHRVVALNPPMQQLLGPAPAGVLGQPLDALAPALSLRQTLAEGSETRDQVQRHAGRDWIAQRAPIRAHGEIVGAAITLYDARRIQAADTELRIQQRQRQRTARHRFEDLVGASPRFVQALARARRFAPTDLTVLIEGESGSGKELFAQAMHNASPRAGRPFVAVNCAAFAESLLESELFGHEEGAFTGARRGGHRGVFEAAHRGTLFLDEIGDMPLALQSRLLRVLQEREVTRVGGTQPVPVDIRVLAATHAPLAERVRQGRFRQDLYYRIHTLRLALPALRERAGDVPALAASLLAPRLRRLGSRLDAQAVLQPLQALLQAYAWPGNVRELENVCERLAVHASAFASVGEIDHAAFQDDCPELFAPSPATPAAGDAPPTPQRVREVLALCRGNRRAAAQTLGVSRSTLWRWLRQSPESTAGETGASSD